MKKQDNTFILQRATLVFTILLGCALQGGRAQGLLDRPDTLSKPRVLTAALSEGIITAGSLTGLQFAWYQQYDQQAFSFFNDWNGWMQMDKSGHAVAGYQAASHLKEIHSWTGMNDRSARWLSSGLSFGYLATVEIMDGFSKGWGFSVYDFAFNAAGVSLFHFQDAYWGEQAVKLKFSFSPSGLTSQNLIGTNFREVQRAEALFGSALYEQWLKDYNGQTHWLNGNLWLLCGRAEWMPKWIDISFGYSADGMLGAESNEWLIDVNGSPVMYHSEVQRARQFLFSLDLNLDHVKLPKGLVWLRPVVHLIKFPFPTLEINSQTGLGFRPVYF